MTDWEQALAAFEPRPMDQLFEELVAVARRWKRGEAVLRPLVTVHLHSGRDVVGAVLDVFEPRMGGGRTLLLSRRGQGRGPETDVLLVPVGHVEAVTLHELPRASAAPSNEPPSPLQLKRKAKAVSEQVTAVLGSAFTVEVGGAADDAALLALSHALDALGPVLQGICGDTLGRDSLRGAVNRVLVSTAGAASVTLNNGQLQVRAAPDKRLTAEALKPQVEVLL